MGFDTRYWGPSGWELFHLIAFKSTNPEKILEMMKDILPCKFCRESTAQYVKELPLKGDPGKWLYDIHNKVNHKLRSQCVDDPLVINPGPDPSFEEIKKRYDSLKPSKVPGRDFLFSIASNYPDIPLQEQKEVQQKFLIALSEKYPFKSLQETFKKYITDTQPNLENQKTYMKWMYDLLKKLSEKIHAKIPSYKGYVQRVMYYKSGCSTKSYKGKTCRNKVGGKRKRDYKRTRRIVCKNLLICVSK